MLVDFIQFLFGEGRKDFSKTNCYNFFSFYTNLYYRGQRFPFYQVSYIYSSTSVKQSQNNIRKSVSYEIQCKK